MYVWKERHKIDPRFDSLADIMKNKITRGEIWKSILGYEGIYEVSNFGNVKSILKDNLIMKFAVHYKGHFTIQLWKDHVRKKFFVHRLVAIAFIPNDDKTKDVVNHKDENKQNNHVSNLEWCTMTENTHYYYKGQKYEIDRELAKQF